MPVTHLALVIWWCQKRISNAMLNDDLVSMTATMIVMPRLCGQQELELGGSVFYYIIYKYTVAIVLGVRVNMLSAGNESLRNTTSSARFEIPFASAAINSRLRFGFRGSPNWSLHGYYIPVCSDCPRINIMPMRPITQCLE